MFFHGFLQRGIHLGLNHIMLLFLWFLAMSTYQSYRLYSTDENSNASGHICTRTIRILYEAYLGGSLILSLKIKSSKKLLYRHFILILTIFDIPS